MLVMMTLSLRHRYCLNLFDQHYASLGRKDTPTLSQRESVYQSDDDDDEDLRLRDRDTLRLL